MCKSTILLTAASSPLPPAPGPPQCRHDRRLGLRVGGGGWRCGDTMEKLAVIRGYICDIVTHEIEIAVNFVVVAVNCDGMKCCTGLLLAR